MEQLVIQSKCQRSEGQGRNEKEIKVRDIILGGRLKEFRKDWENLTSDKFVLECIEGCKIEFTSRPYQVNIPSVLRFNKEETDALYKMIDEMERDKIIEKCDLEYGDYVSNVFLREKKDKDEEGNKDIE